MSIFVLTGPWSKRISDGLVNNQSARAIVANCLVVICLTCLLTVSDAFETQQLSFTHQLLLWTIVSMLLVTQLGFLQQVLLKRMSTSLLSKTLGVVAAVSCTVLLMTIELHWMKFTPLLPKQPDPLLEFLVFVAPPVVAMAGLVLLSQYLSIPISRPIHEPSQSNLNTRTSKDLSKKNNLEEIIKDNTVLHIQAQDHYLEIKCTEGDFFIRARMKDALDYLSALNGVQVHRSHWVSSQYMQRVIRDGRDFKILLDDDSVIPVARSRVSQLNQQ